MKFCKVVYSIAAALVIMGLTFNLAAAATPAQADAPIVTIARVDSNEFPYVKIDLSVTDSAGAPISNLTSADFQITEDSIPVPAANLALEAVAAEPVSIVLALDTSVQEASFVRLQGAAKQLVNELGPNDQLALIAFAETATTVQKFTADKRALAGAVDSLIAQGISTALNDAVLQSVNLASAAPTDSGVIILVTNSGNNAGSSSAQTALDAARAAQIPIYTVGYSENAATASLQAIAAATGGEAFDLPDAQAVSAVLPGLAGKIRNLSYQLTFFSALQADNQPHSLTVSVTRGGGVGESRSSFTAISREIGVTVPGLADGQIVVGKLYLVAEVNSALPIVAVEYLLDGQLIASVPAAPYSFEWDSTTVPPGAHQLTVRAADSGGNRGEWSIPVTISLPFKVQIVAPTDRVQVGEELTVEARVETPAQIAQVELRVDDLLVATDTTVPYRFTFSTREFKAGEHTLTVRAVDTVGRTAESSLPMRFTTPWLPLVILWVLVVLLAIASLATLIIGASMARSAVRAQARMLFKTCQVELSNVGNARTRFELRADDPNNALSYEFSLNGTALTQRQVVETLPAMTLEAAVLSPAPAAAAPAGSLPSGASGVSSSGGAAGGAKKVLGVGAMIGGVLSSIGYLIPGSIGASLLDTGTRLQTGQSAVTRLERQADLAKSVAGAPSGSTPPAVGAGLASASGVGARPTPTGVTRPTAASAPSTTAKTHVTQQWSQTPPVEPGQSLLVALTLRPLSSKDTQEYFFRVISQAIDAEGAPPQTEQANAEIKGLSLWQRLKPYVILFVTFAVAVILLIALAAIVVIGLLG